MIYSLTLRLSQLQFETKNLRPRCIGLGFVASDNEVLQVAVQFFDEFVNFALGHDLLSGWEVTVPSVYLNTFLKVKRAHLSKKHSRTKNSRIPKVCYIEDVKKAGG